MPYIVIGGGLAGAECAWFLSRAGLPATLFEMRPERRTPAHETDLLAELVCSNSFRSDEPTAAAVGLLKEEMSALGSLVMEAARATAVPAGKALAVDRTLFAARVTEAVARNPLITLERREIPSLDDPALAGAEAVAVCAGPLASDSLSASLREAVGGKELYFYDAIAPIVDAASIDMEHAFWGSRWRPEDDDYLNCPLTKEEYEALVAAMLAAEKVPCRDFEKAVHFEGCLPVEEMAERGPMTLAFGPLKPVGLTDTRPGHEGRRPFAVIQLRAENRERTAFNLVGFQTKLKYPEQDRVFRMIPALRNAEFLRFGSIHRNTFVNAPAVLSEELELVARPGVFLGGQITGVEGYLESAACGLWLGMVLAARHLGVELPRPPRECALGALLSHLRPDAEDYDPKRGFQPSNVNFGLMPAFEGRVPKKKRKEAYAERARTAFAAWLQRLPRLDAPGAG
ncbi:Methylenetetrahydrofolate--tRNA-(uracil-5-)-methyltransferase trmFO [Desulfovibrio sp. X2]|uniref:methylenetetrahydrofolate--tRNA-(uracil(54)- C(5))-methyltransferase (FADH(2)-oxidizing) TrmFO n=1 Tax=Desulfovibrio sp. X2 TaxID=941449 RepID=UPI000358DA92|nr:methylenetetrahydrofolate--tRNA-(uracil(54)-C(5))-methyltransferase (FADH(2)-oxidizing) TrmFO [Desulfovibrio sp. X2]EPR44759.1 Methylenetetrahydrofolate--tRNA-(uracil-5-)-methyltransferase trmFO [Desulfovibrio sp. X2]